MTDELKPCPFCGENPMGRSQSGYARNHRPQL